MMMKKYCVSISLCILATLFSTPSFAQSEHKTVQVALGKIYYPFTNYPENSNNNSYMIGVDYTFFLHNRIGIGIGIGYEVKDFIIEYSPSSLYLESENFVLNYFHIPLKLNLEIMNLNSHLLSLDTGIEIGRLLSGHRYVVYQNGNVDENLDYYYLDKMIASFSTGISYKKLLSEKIYLCVNPGFRGNLTGNQGINGDSGQGTRFSFVLKLALGHML